MTDELIAERDALKLKAADRDEWQQVAMKVSKERDALRARVDELERDIGSVSVPDCAFSVEDYHLIKAKLDASERACAAFRVALDTIASWQEGDVVDGTFDEPSSATIARHALSSDAARDARKESAE